MTLRVAKYTLIQGEGTYRFVKVTFLVQFSREFKQKHELYVGQGQVTVCNPALPVTRHDLFYVCRQRFFWISFCCLQKID